MSFNTIPFLIFLLVVLVAFYLINPKHRLLVLTFASIVFYGFASAISVLVLVAILFITLLFSQAYVNKKNYSTISIVLIVAILICFKVFLPCSWNNHDSSWYVHIVYPIGLSFYALQAIGYIVDVHDKRINAEIRPIRLTLFLSFFSQSIAGPIHRFKDLATQFDNVTFTKLENISQGTKTILWGYFCKLIIADKIALVIEPILNSPETKDGFSLFIAAILYSFQIYFDFYGYTLIAMGTAWFFGIRLSNNFNSPYLANSFRDFWRRWHITLSQWLRDYVYLRLGGRSSSFWKFGFAVTCTFIVSAFWHGVTLNFFLWGILHALFYLVEDKFRRSRQSIRFKAADVIKYVQRFAFFLLITLTWLVFRTSDLTELGVTLLKIIDIGNWSLVALQDFNTVYLPFVLLLIMVQLFNGNRIVQSIFTSDPSSDKARVSDIAFVVFCLLTLIVFGGLGAQEFLYFSF